MAYLDIRDLNVYYGGIHALRSVDMRVEKGEIVAVIGANGAGKSTLMRSIAGDQKYKGAIVFDGAQLPRDSHLVVTKGISLVPEGRRIFPGLSVLENLWIGAYARKDKARIAEDMEEIFTLFPRLKERVKQMGGSLSGGEQQMLAVSRALIANPRLLLLDEPTLGLAPIVIDELFEKLIEINRAKNLPIVMVEQNAYAALEISHRAYVLATGEVVMEGGSAELLEKDDIVESYLGTKADGD
ncbi:MAG TPA: ABC transporter ATP-binding protein [Clostridia bacterium]|jgi:branched-chain amino acid transport system ATP-binding protein|nr:MAG: High-affinity branched-chain amino acid transport ATP-binding protein LivF [Firmicutes bacterium ADurb.Bin248]HOG00069.1 ABC transporter ATP-binding protein [Clostridia bacterium]HOS17970.1 ABC transporter ATP-binding protein [Clostridia bacterium]HPK15025.1 ABC transporter ATP-binding protein [Clostridia bacterium]